MYVFYRSYACEMVYNEQVLACDEHNVHAVWLSEEVYSYVCTEQQWGDVLPETPVLPTWGYTGLGVYTESNTCT
jgi:hypothetical protein